TYGRECGELGADLVGVRAFEVGQNRDRTPPRGTGRVEVTDRVVGVAEPVEGVDLPEVVAQVAVQVGGVVVRGDRLRVLPELVMDVTQGASGVRLPVAFPEPLVPGEGLLAVRAGGVEVAEQGEVPADRGERVRPPDVVAVRL